MKILQICHKPAFPSVDGGSLAMQQLTKGILSENAQLFRLSFSTHKHPGEIFKTSNHNFKDHLVYVDTKISYLKLIANFLQKRAYPIWRFYKDNVKKEIERIVEEFQPDVVILDGIQCAIYAEFIKTLTANSIIYRAHNVESEIWRHKARWSSNIFKRFYFKALSKQINDLEKNLIDHTDSVVFISESDRKLFCDGTLLENKKVKAHVLPFIPEVKSVGNINTTIAYNQLFFIGSLDWQPNEKGLLWFVEQVLPEIITNIPEVVFHVAGSGKLSKKLKLALKDSHIKFYGRVNDSYEFMKNNGLLIVPLFSGSGVRIKILEAMAGKIPFVSTQVGVSGIETGTHQLKISDDPHNFAEMVLQILNGEKHRISSIETGSLIIDSYYGDNHYIKFNEYLRQWV